MMHLDSVEMVENEHITMELCNCFRGIYRPDGWLRWTYSMKGSAEGAFCLLSATRNITT